MRARERGEENCCLSCLCNPAVCCFASSLLPCMVWLGLHFFFGLSFPPSRRLPPPTWAPKHDRAAPAIVTMLLTRNQSIWKETMAWTSWERSLRGSRPPSSRGWTSSRPSRRFDILLSGLSAARLQGLCGLSHVSKRGRQGCSAAQGREESWLVKRSGAKHSFSCEARVGY